MKNEFIPYTEVLALKELGFDESCLGCYSELNEIIIRIPDYRSFKIVSRFNIITNFNTYDNKTISVPLYQQAFRWFREKYNLIPNVSSIFKDKTYKEIEFWFWIANYDDSNDEEVFYDTHEEAELECLKKLIEIVKNDKK